MISISGLCKSFGDHEVLRGIDLEVAEREVVCVIGPSGSGKSTLLRCINRLEEPSAGRIVVGGVEVTGRGVDLDRVRTTMGMVFQQFNLFAHKTALGNVTLALRTVLKLDGATADARGREVLARVGLADKEDALP
ncbi:MAG: ATP-binding cassette domain-containing protein, partial [Actinomycetota bacterium]|nr:ATP-binding cassette domain-containing protein [Actinomycetota bacterium]